MLSACVDPETGVVGVDELKTSARTRHGEVHDPAGVGIAGCVPAMEGAVGPGRRDARQDRDVTVIGMRGGVEPWNCAKCGDRQAGGPEEHRHHVFVLVPPWSDLFWVFNDSVMEATVPNTLSTGVL